jgi:hypothetical protein
MFESDSLFFIYFAGAIATLCIAVWLSHRSRIEFPVLLEFFLASEWTMLPLILFWPILGPAVIAEILLRSWCRRRLQPVSNEPSPKHDSRNP